MRIIINYKLQIKNTTLAKSKRSSFPGKNRKVKGFTLLETIVSLVIFGVISVVMSSIVLNLVAVSIYTDRRNDFLSEINNAVNNIKNELRNSEIIRPCKIGPLANPTANRSLYLVKKETLAGAGRYFELGVEAGTNRLAWFSLESNPAETEGSLVDTCKRIDPAANPAFPARYLTSSNITIKQLAVNSESSSNNPNSLIYVSFDACDSDAIVRKVFDCTLSEPEPYRYMFAISTRNF